MGWDNNNIGAISEAYDRWYSRFPDWEDEEEEEEEIIEPEQDLHESDEDFARRVREYQWQMGREPETDEEWDEYYDWQIEYNKRKEKEKQERWEMMYW